ILVNNAAEQHPQNDFLNISDQQMEKTFRTNVFSMFYLTKAVLPHLKPGSSIVTTSSIPAYAGSKDLIDSSAAKGAITSLTRSLSQSVVDKGIRVNSVAPCPSWTPLLPCPVDAKKVGVCGGDPPMEGPGAPRGLDPAQVYLATEDGREGTGQT